MSKYNSPMEETLLKRRSNMNLYKVLLTHAAPKDHKTAIKEYLVAEDDKVVFEYLKTCDYTYWQDYEDDEYDEIPILDYIFEHMGESEIDDKWTDLYYGATMYDWELSKEGISQSEIDTLVKLDIAKVV